MGLIVYLSDFGPLSNPVFPLWWDMLAATVFSLAIYYWAGAVALPTERIERMIARWSFRRRRRSLRRSGVPRGGQSVLNCSNGWRQALQWRIDRHGVGPKMFSSRVSVEPQ